MGLDVHIIGYITLTQLAGCLYIVATPIGNINDISRRAIDTLSAVACIAAEDTRHSGRLLDKLGINKPLLSLHDYNERDKTVRVLKYLHAGKDVALISDAGTPLISDPGYHLVSGCHSDNITVIPIPGPTAATAALSVSGLACDRFVFEGFLPSKSRARRERLRVLTDEPRTMIFYEAPHRIKNFIADACDIFGPGHQAAIARELTKMHEAIRRGGLQDLQRQLDDGTIPLKGEFVVLLNGAEISKPEDAEVIRMLTILSDKLSIKDAVSITSKLSERRRNEVYRLAVEHVNGDDPG